jgi:hypothetical protein
VLRIVFELIVVLAVVSVLLYLARAFDNQRRLSSPSRAPIVQAPSDAVWRATHQGTADDQTEVLVVLRSPGSNQIWDRRTCEVIGNRDPAYDKLLFNAMEDAKARAGLNRPAIRSKLFMPSAPNVHLREGREFPRSGVLGAI